MADEDFRTHIGRIVTRAFAEARANESEKMKAKSAGLPRGGAIVRLTVTLAEEAFLEAGRRAISESVRALGDFYDTPPMDVVTWLGQELARRFEHWAPARVRGLAGEGERSGGGRVPADLLPRMQSIATRLERDLEIELAPFVKRSRLRAIAHGEVGGGPSTSPKRYDVFICHATQDKPDVVEPLADALTSRGLSVWLDKFEIVVGTRIFDAIDQGLRSSRFGVVVLSPAFFERKWTRAELAALAALEDAQGADKILPVWHQVNRDLVAKQSPLLAAIRAANTDDGISVVADEIVAAVLKARQAPPAE